MRQIQINIIDDTKYDLFLKFIKDINYIEVNDMFEYDDDEIISKLKVAEEEALNESKFHDFKKASEDIREKVFGKKI